MPTKEARPQRSKRAQLDEGSGTTHSGMVTSGQSSGSSDTLAEVADESTRERPKAQSQGLSG